MNFLMCAFETLGSLFACVKLLYSLYPNGVFVLWFLPKYLFIGMFKCCVEGFRLLLNLSDDVVWYGCSVHKWVKSVTEYEVECSLDMWLGKLCPVILEPDIRCLLVGAEGKTKVSICLSMIRTNSIVLYARKLVIVGALIIAGGTYGSWVSLVAFFAYTLMSPVTMRTLWGGLSKISSFRSS